MGGMDGLGGEWAFRWMNDWMKKDYRIGQWIDRWRECAGVRGLSNPNPTRFK